MYQARRLFSTDRTFPSSAGALIALVGGVIAFTLSARPAAAIDLGISGGVSLAFGEAGLQDTGVPSRYPIRTMSLISLSTFPHMNFTGRLAGRRLGFKTGILGEFREISQITPPDQAGGNDLGGNGMLFGLGVETGLGRLSFLSTFDLVGWHSTALPQAPRSSYSWPRGFRFVLGYALLPKFDLIVTYYNTAFRTETIETTRREGEKDVVDATTSNMGDNKMVQHFISFGSRIAY